MPTKGKYKPSPAGKVGMGIVFSAIFLSVFDIRLAAIPMFMFLMLCMVAPFFPRFGFFLPVISSGVKGKRGIGLTFDDGPDPRTTPELLRLLAKNRVSATFFVTGERAEAYPALIEAILSSGHLIGNHSYSHDNLVMLKSHNTLRREIETAQNVLKNYGIRPLAFRPPVGITNPILNNVLKELDLYTVNFSCRAMDGGNRFIQNLSKRILKRLRPGNIILLHDICPKHGSLIPVWLNEVQLILWGINKRGWTIMDLSQLIGKPIMEMLK